MARKPLILTLLIVASASTKNAQPSGWQPSSGHWRILIWPAQPPHAQPAPPESMQVSKRLIAGRHFLGVNNVSKPTITLYRPKRGNTGVAVIVFPGGGYKGLAIDLEGTEMCEWLAAHGITGVLLKYRVPNSGPYWDDKLQRHVTPKAFTALEDAQRAMRLVRHNARAWHIDPHKIGVIGFSAGGHMVAAISTHFNLRLYSALDAAEKESCRPDFAIAVYPGHLWSWTPHDNPNFDLNPDIAKNITNELRRPSSSKLKTTRSTTSTTPSSTTSPSRTPVSQSRCTSTPKAAMRSDCDARTPRSPTGSSFLSLG